MNTIQSSSCDNMVEPLEVECVRKVSLKTSIFERWKKFRHSPVTFMVVYSLAGIPTMSVWGYITCIMSTLEKRFDVPVKMLTSALVISDISTLIFSTSLGYYGGNKHRPRLISLGLLLWFVATMFLASPQLIFGSGSLETKHIVNGTVNSTDQMQYTELICNKNDTVDKCSEEASSAMQRSSVVSVAMMCVGLFIGNAGASLYIILGASYVDDNINKSAAAFCFGALAVLRHIGVIIGIFYGSVFLNIYQDPFVDPGIDSSNVNWIGGWWIGYVFIGFQIILFSAAMNIFPRSLRKKEIVVKEESENPDSKSLLKDAKKKSEDADNKSLLKEFPSRLRNLFRNGTLMCTIFAASFAFFSLYGAFLLFPKTLEIVFAMSPVEASSYTGYVTMCSYTVGFILSGLYVWVAKPKPYRMLLCTTIMFVMISIILVAVTRIQCDTSTIRREVEIGPGCLPTCDCEEFNFNPVCDEDRGITYFSECHANCASFSYTETGKLYHECGCNASDTNRAFNVGVQGHCKVECESKLWLYMVLVSVANALCAATSIVHVLITLRCVAKEDKSFSEGLTGSIMSLVAFLPSPVIFSILVDNSCARWHLSNCDTSSSYCLYYDRQQFLNAIFITAAVGQLLAAFFSAGATYFSRNLNDFYKEDE